MGNCCGSKKNRQNFDASELYGDAGDMTIKNGELFNQPNRSYKYQDDLMEEYIKDHIGDKDEATDAVGMISFEFFLSVYKTALVWNRVRFSDTKKRMVARRREALKDKNNTLFRQIEMNLKEEDEKCLQEILEEVLDQIELEEKVFQEALNIYAADQEKQPLIREALEEAQIDRQEGIPKAERKEPELSMSKEEAIAT